jgi:hypothetical protein
MTEEPKQVNIFTDYKQKENHFTNGLVSILKLAELEDLNFNAQFFKELLNINNFESINSFQVLKGYTKKSTADAILTGNDIKILFETKIISGTLREEQISKHLDDLNKNSQAFQYLVMLTPDDTNSNYIKDFLEMDTRHIKHLEWKKVFNFLSNYQTKNNVLKKIIEQYLETIKSMIFEQDIVGIIAKVAFGEKSGVYANKYLEEMKKGDSSQWNTPQQYKNLDGTGRKLLLYDKNLKAITVEVEISKSEKTNEELDYPWSNYFAQNTLVIMEPPIKIDDIQQLVGFEKFTKGQSPYRNLTHEQYKQLMKFNKK